MGEGGEDKEHGRGGRGVDKWPREKRRGRVSERERGGNKMLTLTS